MDKQINARRCIGMEVYARTIQGAREMITEDELEYFVEYILEDISDKVSQTMNDDEMAEKVREVHE